METQLNLKIPHDFELLCLVFTLNPVDILQDYINRISLPKILSGHPYDPIGDDMRLILYRTPNQDPKRIDKGIVKFIKGQYHNELQSIFQLGLEQPELEVKLRKVLNTWRPKFINHRVELRKKSGLKFNIVGYDN